ncbi:hypothetical protein [Parafrankia soli]|nr:hypothetical protein [Parafrankia soli]
MGERVDLLLAEMTLDEKLGRLGSRWIFDHVWQPVGCQNAATGVDDLGF